MNTVQIKEISKWMMIVGGGIFTAGLGTNLVCNHIERKEAKLEHARSMDILEEEKFLRDRELAEEAMIAKKTKDDLYSEKLKTMDAEAFAKFHAENVARANDDVMAKANAIKTKAESDILEVRMRCNNEIDKIRRECLEKVEAATKAREEAIAKYEAIDSLFTNKKEILKAKEALEAAARREQKSKDDKEELLKSIKDILED